MTPQIDPHNPTHLNIPIPPPTQDSRNAAVAAANKAGETAQTAVRDARSKMQKKLRAMELAKSARPDDLRKGQKSMELIVEKGVAECKKIVEGVRKIMEKP